VGSVNESMAFEIIGPRANAESTLASVQGQGDRPKLG
jgi:hypothetical protein